MNPGHALLLALLGGAVPISWAEVRDVLNLPASAACPAPATCVVIDGIFSGLVLCPSHHEELARIATMVKEDRS